MNRIEFRSDKGQLRKYEVTGGGGIRVDAALTRVGVFEYLDANGQISRELKAPETVFDARALEGLKDAPVTIDHPSEFVDPYNWREHAVGHVSGVPTRDAGKPDAVAGAVVIQDARAIEGINSGALKEVSLGYFAEIVDEPGEYNGQKYDRKQTNIRYNHLAIGGHDWGRLGPEVALRINRHDGVKRCDGSAGMTEFTRSSDCRECGQQIITTAHADDVCGECKQITPTSSTTRQNTKPKARRHAMSIISVDKGAVRIDGVPHEPTTDSAREALRVACDRARQDATEETASVVNEQINAASAAFELARENAKLTAELDKVKAVDWDAEVEKRANARAELVAKVRTVAPGIETAGRSDSELVAEALRVAGKTVPEGATDDYKRGVLDSLETKQPQTRQNTTALHGNHGGGTGFDRILAEAEQKRNNSLNGKAK